MRGTSNGGWMQSLKPPHVAFSNFVRERLRVTITDTNYVPIEVAYGAGCAYVALQVISPTHPMQVRGVIAQVEHLSGLAGEANIAWRLLDEESLGKAFMYSDGRRSNAIGKNATYGRVFSRCPRHVLEKLSDTGHVGALSWRRSCWARVMANEQHRRRPLARGDIAMLRDPTMFGDGIERESFLITQSTPLQGIAFGVSSEPMNLARLERLLLPAPVAEFDTKPDEEFVEVLTASRVDCVGYVIRTTETKRIVGATNDAWLAITFERQWNSEGIAMDNLIHTG